MDQPRSETFADDAAWRVVPAPRWTAQSARLFLYVSSLLLDTLSVGVGFLVTDLLLDTYWLPIPDLAFLGTTLSLFVMFSVSKGSQSIETLKDPYLGIQRAIASLGTAFLVAVILLFLTQLGDEISRLGFFAFFGFSALLLILSRLLIRLATKLLLGNGVEATILLLDGTRLAGEPGVTVVDVREMNLQPDLGKPSSIARIAEIIEGYDRVIVACDEADRYIWSIFLQGARCGGEILVGLEQSLGAVDVARFAMRDTLVISRGPLSLPNRILKRTLDLAIAVPASIVLLPLMLAVAAVIRMESEGPIFFRQERIGQNNRTFRIFKFRSMRLECSDIHGMRSAARDDDRVSRVGRFIRRTSIDELPQLLNVIIGDMSIVGPRPHALGSLAGRRLFWDVDPRYWQRHSLKPGITGLAQIRGFRGATESVTDLENRLRCDLEYLGSWSIWLDLQIILATFRVVVHHKAY